MASRRDKGSVEVSIHVGLQNFFSGKVSLAKACFAFVYWSSALKAVACLCYEALCEWHSGEITSCHVVMREAISLAKDLHDMQALVLALFWSGWLAHLESNPA